MRLIASQLIVETVDDAARFEALREEWEELLADSAADCIFLTWEWLYTWWRHMAEDRKLRLILVRADGRLIAIAPLALRPRRWKRLLPFPALEFLGCGSVGSDYLDVIIRRGYERRSICALAERLTAGALAVDFSQIKAGGCHAMDLMRELGGRGWEARRTPTDLCPYIDFAGDLAEQTWESYLSALGSAHRYNLRRRTKNLARQSRFEFERATTEEQRAAGLQSLIELHGRRWRSRGEAGVFGNPAMVSFHGEFSRRALLRGWLRLYVLRVDGQTAAAWYGFNYRGVTSYYQGGFDPAYYKHSVGLVMMGLAIKAAIEEGAHAYDFLRGDEGYKSLWASRERELLRLDLFPPSLGGACYRRAMEWRSRVKQAITRPAAPARTPAIAAPAPEGESGI